MCLCVLGMGWTKKKRDVWLDKMPSIRLRVFASLRKEERRRRNCVALSGKMWFSVTMAFVVHNLSRQALWGMCLSLPPTGRGQNQSWLIVGLAFTVSLTYMSSVYLSHQERTNTQCNAAPKKEQWLMFGKPSISPAEHFESCCLSFECTIHLKWLAFVLKSYETLTWKSTICHS